MGTRPPSPVDELEGSTKKCVALRCAAITAGKACLIELLKCVRVCACLPVRAVCWLLQAPIPRTG